MISVSGKIWTEQKVNKNLVEKFKQDYGLGDIITRLIISRNYDTSEIYGINNKQKLINIFKDDKDFDKASLILINAINNNENICILGDYDVDGACATSLLVRYFNYINQKHFFYIPDRTKDGYGASKKLFQKLILRKPKLIIMVDCGSTSNEAIEYLNNCNEITPDDTAVLFELSKNYLKLGRNIEARKLDNYMMRLSNLQLNRWVKEPELVTRYAAYEGIDGEGLIKTEKEIQAENKAQQDAMAQQQLMNSGADALGKNIAGGQ